jgi:multiple sugar transport system substrate-binding protein
MPNDDPEPIGPSNDGLISRRGLLKGGAALAAASIASPLLSGIASASPKSFGSFSSRRSVQKTQLTLMSWEQYSAEEAVAWKKLISNFTEANPSIGVNWVGWPFANYQTNIAAEAQAGKIDADVVMCPPEVASMLINDYDLCLPIGDLAAEVGLKPNEMHEQYMVGGKLYGLGILVVAVILEYNAKVLASGGYSAPPSTMDEWLAMTEKLTIPSKQQYGQAMITQASASADAWLPAQNFVLAYGGAFADGKTLTIDSKENIAGMEYWVQMTKVCGLAGTAEAIL